MFPVDPVAADSSADPALEATSFNPPKAPPADEVGPETAEEKPPPREAEAEAVREEPAAKPLEPRAAERVAEEEAERVVEEEPPTPFVRQKRPNCRSERGQRVELERSEGYVRRWRRSASHCRSLRRRKPSENGER